MGSGWEGGVELEVTGVPFWVGSLELDCCPDILIILGVSAFGCAIALYDRTMMNV